MRASRGRAFLVATGRFGEWVDRDREFPSHRLWADYLGWVFLQADQGIVAAKVLEVAAQGSGGWHIVYDSGSGADTTFADAVVLTGAGKPRAIAIDATNLPADRIFDAETFWDARSEVIKHSEIAVAGAGGAAGAIIAWLCQAVAERENSSIHSISPMGTLFPRGDGFAERRWFTDPTDWRELSLSDRRKLVERTEGGVISLRNKRIIDGSRDIAFVRGHAARGAWDGSELKVEIDYNDKPAFTLKADCLINAIGFDAWSLLDLVKAKGVKNLLRKGEKEVRDELAERMLPDLSFPADSALGVGLHVPVLASLARGPGMGTLGSLGLMAKCVLDGYLD